MPVKVIDPLESCGPQLEHCWYTFHGETKAQADEKHAHHATAIKFKYRHAGFPKMQNSTEYIFS